MQGKVAHFEIPADNIDRAKKFYRETFEWESRKYSGMDYTILKTTDTDENNIPKEPGAINGGMFKRNAASNMVDSPTFSISVDNIDEAIKKIKNAGGLIVKEKMQVGDMGLMAYFKDTEGNILSVWQPLKTIA